MSEPAAIVRAEDKPSWAEVVRHAEHGESVSPGGHFAAWEQPAAYAADLDRAVRLGQERSAARSGQP
jgi:hypothetical protein